VQLAQMTWEGGALLDPGPLHSVCVHTTLGKGCVPKSVKHVYTRHCAELSTICIL